MAETSCYAYIHCEEKFDDFSKCDKKLCKSFVCTKNQMHPSSYRPDLGRDVKNLVHHFTSVSTTRRIND